MVDETANYPDKSSPGDVLRSPSSCETFKAALLRGEPPVFEGLVHDLPEPRRSQEARRLVQTFLEYSRCGRHNRQQ